MAGSVAAIVWESLSAHILIGEPEDHPGSGPGQAFARYAPNIGGRQGVAQGCFLPGGAAISSHCREGRMTDQPSILVDRRAGFHVVTLNRPQRLNAFTEEMHVALRAALDEAEGDDACGALLITGAGRAFCAGQDLSDRMPGSGPPRDLGASLDTFYNPL